MIDVVVGGQFGSEAKGHVAAILAGIEPDRRKAYVRVGGPNAGHSVVDAGGRKWALRTIPVGAPISNWDLFLAAGSEIDYQVLLDEVAALEAAGIDISNRLFIDYSATELLPTDIADETMAKMNERIGSTSKGVGEARAKRLMRTAPLVGHNLDFQDLGEVCDTGTILRQRQAQGDHIIVEGTQGYGLGLHAGYYPYATSGDCRAIDFMAQAGLVWDHVRTWIVYRTWPIRVAGNSGPLFNEISWAQLGAATEGYIQPEQTTVTKRTRRVGAWDPLLASWAWHANGGPFDACRAVLTFVDYLDSSLAGCEDFGILKKSPAWSIVDHMQDDVGAEFALFTTSADTHIWHPDYV